MAMPGLVRQFLDDLRAQRLRSALTVLGVTWGTVAIIVLLAFGAGFERQTHENMAGMGDGIVIVWGGTTALPFAGFPDGRVIRLREDDAELLASEVPELEAVSVEYGRRGLPLRRGSSHADPYITGTDPAYAALRNIRVQADGRFLNTLDVERRRRVVVLGDAIKEQLFGEEPAVGETVFLGDVPFTVIGVMAPKTQNSSYNSRDSDRIFVPAANYRSLFDARNVNNLVYRPLHPELAEAAAVRVHEVLGRRYRFDPADPSALQIWDTSEQFGLIRSIFLGLNIFLAIVGSFTLVVGGIGVANIMYIVVRERTPEIGIKRSLGARRRHILGQFLGEAAMVVALGAAIGFLLALLIVRLLGLLPFQDEIGSPELSARVAVAAMALLAAVTFLSGYFPARKAARLDPMDCLRGTGV